MTRTALLILDYQIGIADLPYARTAVSRTVAAVAAARDAGLLILYTKVAFLPGAQDVAPMNLFFGAMPKDRLPTSDTSRLLPELGRRDTEAVLDKNRFSAFSGSLGVVLRSQRIERLVLCGVATSGVVLSTFSAAADEDFALTILSDGCADPKGSLHSELMTNLFPRSATVMTVEAWRADLAV